MHMLQVWLGKQKKVDFIAKKVDSFAKITGPFNTLGGYIEPSCLVALFFVTPYCHHKVYSQSEYLFQTSTIVSVQK